MTQDTKKAVIKIADMSTEMQVDAVAFATTVETRHSTHPMMTVTTKHIFTYKQALEKLTIEKDVASHIKKEFDKKHGPTWHCVVGRNFGSYVTHETKHFIYFYIDQVAILLFKDNGEETKKKRKAFFLFMISKFSYLFDSHHFHWFSYVFIFFFPSGANSCEYRGIFFAPLFVNAQGKEDG
ncbi:hypothetical protein RFI_06293 [Reticulomyxa filosa]|uniref:Dynein light chain n=1 Tax=Reticulomyxa filosa TaxID=46433 RepID=X6NZV1_RETFI|nr:hypothetical protein RFI_06293 [Reticulomyxa filosa]|eukprot:ETO30827.1 hypothetical protein RFI_06293 [Reticulomyxa filosa]